MKDFLTKISEIFMMKSVEKKTIQKRLNYDRFNNVTQEMLT